MRTHQKKNPCPKPKYTMVTAQMKRTCENLIARNKDSQLKRELKCYRHSKTSIQINAYLEMVYTMKRNKQKKNAAMNQSTQKSPNERINWLTGRWVSLQTEISSFGNSQEYRITRI